MVRAKALNTYHGLRLAIFLRKDEDIRSKTPYQVESITFSPIWKPIIFGISYGMITSSIYPTETQFRYHAEKFIDIKKRAGSVIYNKDLRGITGSSRSEARGPGDVYQIDATIADIYLVSRHNRHEVVGRPELYFVTDVFSRMIVGFYACLESASWENARYALLNAFNDKVAFCQKYGVTIQSEDWPCCGLPRALIVDNGELISKKAI